MRDVLQVLKRMAIRTKSYEVGWIVIAMVLVLVMNANDKWLGIVPTLATPLQESILPVIAVKVFEFVCSLTWSSSALTGAVLLFSLTDKNLSAVLADSILAIVSVSVLVVAGIRTPFFWHPRPRRVAEQLSAFKARNFKFFDLMWTIVLSDARGGTKLPLSYPRRWAVVFLSAFNTILRQSFPSYVRSSFAFTKTRSTAKSTFLPMRFKEIAALYAFAWIKSHAININKTLNYCKHEGGVYYA
jgi:hypothetical protein